MRRDSGRKRPGEASRGGCQIQERSSAMVLRANSCMLFFYSIHIIPATVFFLVKVAAIRVLDAGANPVNLSVRIYDSGGQEQR